MNAQPYTAVLLAFLAASAAACSLGETGGTQIDTSPVSSDDRAESDDDNNGGDEDKTPGDDGDEGSDERDANDSVPDDIEPELDAAAPQVRDAGPAVPPNTQDAASEDDGDGDEAPSPVDAAAAVVDAFVPSDVFDSSALEVEGASTNEVCRLTADGRNLLVRVHNRGTAMAPDLLVRVETSGTTYAQSRRTGTVAPGGSVEVVFDRGALVGFGERWNFEVTLDPEGVYGPIKPKVFGSCSDLRSRATQGMTVLRGWYDDEAGIWPNEWWRAANMLEVTIDYVRETGDASHMSLIANTYNKQGTNDFTNESYVDEAFWAHTWLKAYDLTHQWRYLRTAQRLFEDIANGWSSECGGGIVKDKAGTPQLAIVNELFLTLAARLHSRTGGEGGPGSYLDWAQRTWAWLKNSGMIGEERRILSGIDSSCAPTGSVYTLQQGAILGGLVELWRATGDDALLDEAEAIAKAGLSYLSDVQGVLVESSCEPDCAAGDLTQFKGIFVRHLALLYEVRPRPQYQVFLVQQSESLWKHARDAGNQFGMRWQGPFDSADAARQSSALDALVAAVRAANMNLALTSSTTGSAPCLPREDVDRAIDGSSRLDSKWCSTGEGGQTLTLDLGAPRYVVGFRVRHAGAAGEDAGWNTRDFEIEVSDDGNSFRPSVKVTGNTANVTTHLVPGLTARYVRLHITTAQTRPDAQAARIYELEVFGVER